MEVILVLNNIRSSYNVGAILRTFEGFGGSQVVCSGVTPCVFRPGILPHVAEKLAHQLEKTALGAEKTLSISFLDDILGFLTSEKAAGAVLAGLENNIKDSRLIGLSSSKTALEELFEAKNGSGADSFGSKVGKFSQKRVILVLGEEVSGISEEILGLLDVIFEIPMKGKKESFNVSVASGIALYELMGR